MRRILTFILIISLLCPVVQAAGDEKYVALTFDDGPSGRFTRRLLEGLEERDVKATFLLCGYRIKDYPGIAQTIFDSGHEIGLHGYSHDNMAAMSEAQVRRELEDTLALLPEGCSVSLMRPPGGKLTDAVKQAAREMDLAIVSWSVDPQDWATDSAAAIHKAVLDQAGDGDIILLHDMSDSSVTAALAIIDDMTAQGYQFVTVSELARIQGCELVFGQNYSQFRGG